MHHSKIQGVGSVALGLKSKADKISTSPKRDIEDSVTDEALKNKPWLDLKKAKQKKMNISVQAIVGNLIFSDTEVWAYYEIPTTIYDFLDNSSKVGYAQRLTTALSGIVKNQDEAVDCHLYITNSPIDVSAWEDNYVALSESWKPKEGFQEFMENQLDILMSQNLFEKRCYLGVRLGKRHAIDTEAANPFNVGFKDALTYLKKFLNNMLLIQDKTVDKDELQHAKIREKDLFQTLSSSALQATRATAEDLALAIKKILYPAMPCPLIETTEDDVWEKGDLIADLGGIIGPKNPKYVKIEQLVGDEFMTGYHATLTFKKFAEDLNIPYSTPWIYSSIFTEMTTPFDVSCRFTLVPARKIKKDIEKGINQTKDALENAYGANATPAPSVMDEMYQADEMQREVEANKTKPWVSGTYRIGINAETEDQLSQYCKQMIANYDEGLSTKLVWTYHDQLDLLMEFMPGDHLRESSFVQTTNLEIIGVSGFNILNNVGDEARI